MFKEFFRKYFSFTSSEKNGLIVLVSLIMLLFIARMAVPWLRKEKNQDFSEFRKEIDEFGKSLADSTGNLSENQQHESVTELFFFDPNTVSASEMKKLGLSPAVIRNILKYRDSGGKFHKREDLMKIYRMDMADYLRLESYIQIMHPGEYNETAATGSERKNTVLDPVPINMADSADLVKIYGIGPVLSSRIIKYRNLLGGYVRKEQLLEVYGLTSERFEEIKDAVFIDTANIMPIFLNKMDEYSLDRHPYMNLYQARALISYREINGRFNTIDEIKKNQLLPEEVFDKIKPYLRVD